MFVDSCVLSCSVMVWLLVTPQTIACYAPLFMGFPRQEYWSGFPCPSPGNLPNPGIELISPILQTDSLLSKPPGQPKNIGVGCHFLLQGIFPTQGLNLHLLHWQIVYQCTVWESLRNLYIYADTYNHAHTYEKGQLPTERCPPRTVMTAKWSWLGALLPHSACFHWWRWTPSASPRWPLTCCPPAISPPVIYLLTY